MNDLQKRLRNSTFLSQLNQNREVEGYHSPTTGRITYNKVVSKRSFAVFTDIISSIVPIEIVIDPDQNHVLPSIAKVLKKSYEFVYPKYLYVTATMDEFTEFEDEEDQEYMDSLIEFVDNLPQKTAVVGIAIQKSEAMGSAHACAFIVWKHSARKYKFAYYDPLAFKKGKKSYDYAERAFVSDRYEQNIEFINLNMYCFRKTPEEFHCSQYIMNAEYCYIYSLYFLHKWAAFGAKLHRSSFKKAITSTYIVKPETLTRTDNRESMIYRVTMMSYVCSVLLNYLKSLSKKQRKYIEDVDQNIQRIQDYLDEFHSMYGFDLITGS